jgi:hypothetical protein
MKIEVFPITNPESPLLIENAEPGLYQNADTRDYYLRIKPKSYPASNEIVTFVISAGEFYRFTHDDFKKPVVVVPVGTKVIITF